MTPGPPRDRPRRPLAEDEDISLECRPGEAGCAASLGFDGLSGQEEPGGGPDEALSALRHAWKAKLARDGKLRKP